MPDFGFKPSEYKDPVNNFEPLPKGVYFIKAEEAEMLDAASGNGSYIKTVFVVTRGDCANRKVFVNFNVIHTNEIAQRIGREQMSAWCRACGKPEAKNTDQLLEIEFKAEIVIEPGKGQYGPQNRIMGWHTKDADLSKTAPAEQVTSDAKPASEEGKTPPKDTTSGKKPAGSKVSNPWD